MKYTKLLISLMLMFVMIALVGCNTTSTTTTSSNPYKPTSTKKEEKIDYVGELRVYNAAEYMDM